MKLFTDYTTAQKHCICVIIFEAYGNTIPLHCSVCARVKGFTIYLEDSEKIFLFVMAYSVV